MTTIRATGLVRTKLLARYPEYDQQKPGIRVLLCMSILAKDEPVVEVGGNNKGPWVEAILGAVHLHPGYAWCAASIYFSCVVAGVHVDVPHPAAVSNWLHWANDSGRLHDEPKRGYLCTMLHPNGQGHMGTVAEVHLNGDLRTYEGNTTPPHAIGNQRDGGGLYERVRQPRFFTKFISLD